MTEKEKILTPLLTVKQLLEVPVFRVSLIKATNELAIRKNTLNILPVYTGLEILAELKEIKTILKRQAGVPETDEEREVRIEKEIEDANKKLEDKKEDDEDEQLSEEEMDFEKDSKPKTIKRRIKK